MTRGRLGYGRLGVRILVYKTVLLRLITIINSAPQSKFDVHEFSEHPLQQLA